MLSTSVPDCTVNLDITVDGGTTQSLQVAEVGSASASLADAVIASATYELRAAGGTPSISPHTVQIEWSALDHDGVTPRTVTVHSLTIEAVPLDSLTT